MIYKPENDGTDHINVYSKGRTELGRLLSNFAHTPFVLDEVKFESVEGFWYWIVFRAHPSYANELRSLIGWKAKQRARNLLSIKRGPIPTHKELLLAYLAKAEQHRNIRDMLVASNLPFTHYYVYNGVVHTTEWEWTATLWADVRLLLRVDEVQA